MASDSGNTLMQKLIEAVEREVSEQSVKIVEKHKKQMGEEIEAVIKDTVGKMGIRIARYSQIQYADNRIIIQISDERMQ